MIAAATRCRPTRATLLARRVRERRRGGTGDRGESDGDLDEPPTGGGAPPVQQGDEHPADDGGDEGDLGEAGEGDLAVNGQRDARRPAGQPHRRS